MSYRRDDTRVRLIVDGAMFSEKGPDRLLVPVNFRRFKNR